MDDVIEVPKKFRHCFKDETTEFAGMANPATNPDDTGLLAFDCGVTSTITSSLYNMSEVVPKKVKIQLAQEGASMTSTHVGIKSIKDILCL